MCIQGKILLGHVCDVGSRAAGFPCCEGLEGIYSNVFSACGHKIDAAAVLLTVNSDVDGRARIRSMDNAAALVVIMQQIK